MEYLFLYSEVVYEGEMSPMAQTSALLFSEAASTAEYQWIIVLEDYLLCKYVA